MQRHRVLCLAAAILAAAACSNRGSSNSDHPTGGSAASGSSPSTSSDPDTRTPTNAGGGSAGSAAGGAAGTATGSANGSANGASGSANGSSAPNGSPAPTGPAVADAIRARICAAEPCGGPMSSIDVYRDAKGNVKKLFRLYGRCSHNPAIYFDPDGKQTELIPEKPIVPGSAEAQEIQAKHDKQISGLTKAESLGCR